jgi:hypothetical protein
MEVAKTHLQICSWGGEGMFWKCLLITVLNGKEDKSALLISAAWALAM